MKTIFCPIDFSEESITAAEWATLLASKRDWSLSLFHKFQIYSKAKERQYGSDVNLFELSKKEAEEKLTELKKQLCTKLNIDQLKSTIHTDFGIGVEDVIVKAAEEEHADMIVMATEGADSFSEIIWGSTSTQVMENTNIPVLVIPPGTNSYIPKKIVYATDLKNETSAILNYVIDLAFDLESSITFLHINTAGDETDIDFLKNKITSHIHTRKLANISNKIDFETMADFDIYEGISEFSKNRNADMVILGHHPKNFFKFLMKGDLTRLMTLYPFLPVLILHKNK